MNYYKVLFAKLKMAAKSIEKVENRLNGKISLSLIQFKNTKYDCLHHAI